MQLLKGFVIPANRTLMALDLKKRMLLVVYLDAIVLNVSVK